MLVMLENVSSLATVVSQNTTSATTSGLKEIRIKINIERVKNVFNYICKMFYIIMYYKVNYTGGFSPSNLFFFL